MWLEHQTHFNEHFYSDFFTISELQVLVASPTASPVGITISESASYLASLVSVRSVTLSMPCVTSKEHSYAQLDNGQHSMVPSNVYVYKNFPCAIYFLPQTLIKTGSSKENNHKGAADWNRLRKCCRILPDIGSHRFHHSKKESNN